ncbi:MAG TPA: cytochrome c3 family protein, partial [Longimicrobiales bacterium]|nr:cytochrome c3 family protein [Longimicrobiales bacterium]
MGRRLLIGVLAALAFGCTRTEPPPAGASADSAGNLTAVSAEPSAHEQLSCTACHQGPRADGERGAVPRAACTTSGCHSDGGPAEVELAATRFEHRAHGAQGVVEPTCAGCHTHAQGSRRLTPNVDACALCHRDELSGEDSRDCRTCHQDPEHVTLTNQGVPVPHASLPWLETGCVRCHYDVAEPKATVALRKCRDCHNQLEEVTARGIATNLHPKHAGLSCTSCHEESAHHVRGMSSAVSLQCADCHTRAHEQPLSAGRHSAETCASCHGNVHDPQQRLMLGLLPEGGASPSSKFLAGMTCRSCHVPTARDSAVAVRGQAEACASCHSSEYRTVLTWWLDGVKQRGQLTSAYTTNAVRALSAAPDTAQALAQSAAAMVKLVNDAGGHHNLELSDRIFREAIRRVAAAYQAAGRSAPPPPELGSPVHYGLCSYCHYDPKDPWNYN